MQKVCTSSLGSGAQPLSGKGVRRAMSTSRNLALPGGPVPMRLGGGCSVSAKRVSSTCRKIILFLFYASLVGQCSASRDSSFAAGSVQRPIWSCTEQVLKLVPVTSLCDVGPFGCHMTTTMATVETAATTRPATRTTSTTADDAATKADTTTTLVATTNATKTVLVCRFPMVDVHPMAYAMGAGFARPGVAIRLPASAPTSSFVPQPPETDFVQIFRPHFGADWQEEYDDDSDQEEESDLEGDLESDPTDNSSAPAAPQLALPSPVEHERVEDYGVACPTSPPPADKVEDIHLGLTEDTDEFSDDTVGDDFVPRRPQTVFQRIGAVRRLLYSRLRTSTITRVHLPSMLVVEPNTAPVVYPFWDEVRFPAPVREHRLLRTPPPPPPNISEIYGVEAAEDLLDLWPVRFENPKWLDELLPTTVHVVRQCYFPRRHRRASWVHDHVWPIRRVIPSRMLTSAATRANTVDPLPAPLVTHLGVMQLPSPALFVDLQPPPMPLDELPRTGAPRVQAPWPFGVSDADLKRLMAIDVEPSSVLFDARISNASYALGICDASDNDDEVLPRSQVDETGLSTVDIAASAPLAPSPAHVSEPTPTWMNVAIMILAVVVVAEFALLAQVRRERDALRSSVKAFHRKSVFAALKHSQARHRVVRARVSRVHQRLREADAAQKNSESIILDLNSAPLSRRGAIRRLRPRSARCSAVRPLLKSTSIGVSQPKRPLSARETARKSTVQQECIGAFLAA